MGGVAGAAEKVIVHGLRLLIGGVFIYAGVAKALNPAAFAMDVDNFRLLPYALSCAMGVYLPWLEILCGLALIIGILRSGATLLLAGMLVVFLIALISAWARGLDINGGMLRPRVEQVQLSAGAAARRSLARRPVFLRMAFSTHRVTRMIFPDEDSYRPSRASAAARR